MTNMTRLVSLAVVTLLIVFLGVTFFQVIAPFLMPLFLAGILAMLSQPVQDYFLTRTQGRTQLSAGLTTGSVLLGISIPVVLVVLVATFQVFYFVSDVLEDRDWGRISETIRTELDVNRVAHTLRPIATYWDDDITEPELQDKIIELRERLRSNLQNGLEILVENTIGVANRAVGILGSLASLTVSFLMFVIALYYFLADGPALLATSERLIPIGIDYQRQLRTRFNRVVRAVVMATFLAALGQGFATATMLCFYFGFRHFMILFLFATFASMVPLFGTWLVWGPCVVWLALMGEWVPAILITLIGSTLIGWMDNLIRTYVLQSDAQLHPLLAFVSVLGGVQVMGLWGVFIAPIVAAILHALIVIFNAEVTELSKERFAEKAVPTPTPTPDPATTASPAPDLAPAPKVKEPEKPTDASTASESQPKPPRED